ncbi:hypothetical protein P9272_32695 [Mesorhizobium sp. WSM4976]|uniref:COG3904 family protein n=1 Tax=Mesorhizobium sp. WSM4976 TaxID=3038549 RepID=UPI0024179438|nr:hypothetical protein [Mesorhizobium sp. WSM4976]MDG4898294.1 hypothetical protein [Mesorhizobium sp. WSM4976]
MAATCQAVALDYTPVSSPGEQPFLVVSGEFGVNESLTGFSDAVVRSGARVIVFNSPGGSVGTAIQLGRMIRAAGLDTLQIRQLQCASACSLAFLGGVRRVAETGSIGVHRSSFDINSGMSADEAVAQIQAGTAQVMGYMTEMGVDPKLMQVALSYDRSDMRYLSASEMSDLRVTNVAVSPPPVDTSQIPTRPNPAPAPVDANAKQLENAAVAFIKGLIQHHGDNAALALAQVQASYAPTVEYYGKWTDLSSIIQDKRTYFLRWPERGYSVRDSSVMVTCANDQCMVSGIYDWVVRSLPRHKQAKGVANFSYTISIGPNPKIIAETGKVQR